MADPTLPIPPLPQLMEALLELEAAKPGAACLGLAQSAMRAGLPRKAIAKYLVAAGRSARELRVHLRESPPDFDLTVAILTPDQALAYLYEIEEVVSGPVSELIAQNWSGLDDEDQAQLITATLAAARHVDEEWRDAIGPIRWNLKALNLAAVTA
jgi:hypothetical protein